jgi:hypothetical protein
MDVPLLSKECDAVDQKPAQSVTVEHVPYISQIPAYGELNATAAQL